jgi:hypothetical protein
LKDLVPQPAIEPTPKRKNAHFSEHFSVFC